MNILTIQNVQKAYHNHKAVDDITFSIPKGSIFGMLGPNGAGKTSLIRVITGITRADSGTVLLNNEPVSLNTAKYIGYMPEERGLYKRMKVAEQLMYLAQLKGMSETEAKKSIKYWFDKLEMGSWWNKKIEELSKGMSQKVQFVATVAHNPHLLILDEPFSGLDPLNANLLKDEIFNLHKNGMTIIFSTHRMEQVEEICNEIVLINKGKLILEGEVNKIRNDFKQNKFSVVTEAPIEVEKYSSIIDVESQMGNELIFKIREGVNTRDIIRKFIENDEEIKSFNEILPGLNEIFIEQVQKQS
jgi:ABC-2 type transport system ATP-binding protein